jgi:ketosteroid isomerase-like protein
MKGVLYPAKILILIFLIGCSNNNTSGSRAKAIEEIKKAEKDFAQMASEKGIAESFWYYADSNAVIRRKNDSLIHGKEQIRHFYLDSFYLTARVVWSPDFADVSEDGTLGYTYGKYTWSIPDSNGKISEFKGIFHTVWKKQNDGSWKYVWD